MREVTVALPVRNGGPLLDEVLAAVRKQSLDGVSVQLLVCDSGSSDDSVRVARDHGAEVIEIPPSEFSHGGTRNLLMEEARGDHVAFLTQDAVPADEHWLTQLLKGFDLADDVAMVFGPYVPRPEASLPVARELSHWFCSLSPDGAPRIDRLDTGESGSARTLLGRKGYFTDANGCVSRAAWRHVGFRPVAYAEDHVLAHDMLRTGYAKAYVPAARVIHSHDYSSLEWLRRSFDEARAIHGIYGFDESGEWRRAAVNIWGLVGADLRWARHHEGCDPAWRVLSQSLKLHLVRGAGTMLGTRAHRLPDSMIKMLSLSDAQNEL